MGPNSPIPDPANLSKYLKCECRDWTSSGSMETEFRASPRECPVCQTMCKVETMENLRKNIKQRPVEDLLKLGDKGKEMLVFMQSRLMKQIKGCITETDVDFLISHDMQPGALTKEAIVPIKVFT